jgi:hypothetical protein
MNHTMLYRNPESGLLEFAEPSFVPKSALTWGRDEKTGAIIEKPIEFASNSQLSILRIADPILTSLVQGFRNTEVIGDKLCTPVRMAKESGKFPAFGKEAFVIRGDLKRALGGKVARLSTQTGYVTMSLSEYALGFGVENRELNEWAGTPDQLVNSRMLQTVDNIALYREYLQATLMTTYTNYASGFYASGAAKAWASTGDPIADFEDMRQVIMKSNGRRPNKAWFNPAAWLLFKKNPAVLNRIKYGGSNIDPAMVTQQMAAALLEVDEVLVGYGVYGSPSANAADGGVKKSALTGGYVWEKANSCCAGLCIVGTGGGIEPAFSYTWERMNSPVVESWYDNSTKETKYDYEHFFDPAVTLNSAGAILYSIA